GILVEAEDLLALKPRDRISAIDGFIRGRLAVDLGDYVSLDLRLTDQNERGTFYQIRGRIAGSAVGQVALDVDCDPHVTAPVVHSFFQFCRIEIPGLKPGMRTHTNPADIFAEKMLALKRCELFNDKPRYAKHLCDLYQMLRLKLADPDLVVESLTELSRTSGIPVAELFPLPALAGVGDRYRDRRKRVLPDQDVPLHVLNQDLREIAPQLRPIAQLASTGEYRPVMTRADIAHAIRDLWLPVPSDFPSRPIGSHSRKPVARIADAFRRNTLPGHIPGPSHSR
ncbi:MAG: nucleotidyl transferase AbiEii/AbiGii toxin family protein, partial [Mycobacteriales bacterium]